MEPMATVIRPNEEQAHDRGSGVRTTYLVTRERGATAFSSGLTDFEPGAALPFHSHDCEESVVVLSGIARFETDAGAHQLRAGDATWVPVGAVHRFTNDGDIPLRILWTYGSVTARRTLAATGQTFAVGSSADMA